MYFFRRCLTLPEVSYYWLTNGNSYPMLSASSYSDSVSWLISILHLARKILYIRLHIVLSYFDSAFSRLPFSELISSYQFVKPAKASFCLKLL